MENFPRENQQTMNQFEIVHGYIYDLLILTIIDREDN